VVRDLIHILDRSDNRGADRSPVVEALQLSPCSAVRTLDQLGLDWVVLVGCVCVDPLLDFNAAGAVIELVGGVGGLCRDVAYLPDKGELAGKLVTAGGKNGSHVPERR
jgi:hypothetical protein